MFAFLLKKAAAPASRLARGSLAVMAFCWLAAAAADEPVELRLWRIPAKTATVPAQVAVRRVYDEFCRRHPEIRVKAVVPLRLEGPAEESNEFLAIAGGVAPDVFYLYGRKVGDYISQGFLLPLNEYLADYERRHGAPYAGIAAPDKVWELCIRGDRVLAAPVTYYSMALMCDIGMFAKAGLANRYPRDWDELYAMARRLTVDPAKEPGMPANLPTQYGLYMVAGLHAGWHYLQYVWSAGGEVVRPYLPVDGRLEPVPPPLTDYESLHIRLSNAEEYARYAAATRDALRARELPESYTMDDLQWRLETDGPDAIEALKFYRKLTHQPWLRNGDHEFDLTPAMLRARRAVDPETGATFDLDDPVVRQRVYHGVTTAFELQSGARLANALFAMQIGTLSEVSTVDPKAVAFVPFPSRPGFPPAAFIAGGYMGVNAAVQEEDRPGRRDRRAIQEAAWRYIEFTTGPAAQAIIMRTYIEYGLEEFVRPALLQAAGYEDILDRIDPARRLLWKNLEQYARVEPYCKGFSHVMTRELNMAIEPIIAGRPDPETGDYQRDPQAVMSEVCRNVNTMILGEIPEEVVRRRSRLGWILFAAIATGLALGARLIVRLAMRAQARARDDEGFGVGGHPGRRRLYAWIFLLPAIASVAIWAYLPLARGLLMAFQDYNILGNSAWVGLRNFVAAVSDPKFWRYLLQTMQYMAMLVGLGFCAPILLALLLTEIPRGKIFLRTVYYLPAVTTGLVTLFLWKNLLFSPQRNGVLNSLILSFNRMPLWLAAGLKLTVFLAVLLAGLALLRQAWAEVTTRRGRLAAGSAGAFLLLAPAAWSGRLVLQSGWSGLAAAFFSGFNFQPQLFLRDPTLAMFWLVIPVIWAHAGPGCLIYLAALKGIPEEQYEAADIDGAGLWQKFMNVTYPNLKALIIINFVGAVIAGFKESGNIFVMTGGGPEDATMTTGLYIWYNAFMFLNFGLATSMAWIMGAMLIGFTLTQLRILNKLQFKAAAGREE